STLDSSLHASVKLPDTYTGWWIIKWSGTGKMRFISSNSSGVIVRSGDQFVRESSLNGIVIEGTDPRVELNFAVPPSSINVVFDQSGHFFRMANAVLVRSSGIYAKDELAIDSGLLEEIFNEDFLAQLRELNPRVIRPMGWTMPNESNNISRHR